MQRSSSVLLSLMRTTQAFGSQAGAAEAGAQQLMQLHSGIVLSSAHKAQSSLLTRPRIGALSSALSFPASQEREGHQQHQQFRFAGDYKPEVPGNAVDNWAAMRATFNKERPNSLGGSYYSNVAVFAFAYTLNDFYFFPARTQYLAAFVAFLLYVRRNNFVPTFPGAQEQQQ